MAPLPPTSPALALDETRPYFLWWMDATVGDLRAGLRAADPDERAYWMGALLREANTRDVWLYVTAEEVRAMWPRLQRQPRQGARDVAVPAADAGGDLAARGCRACVIVDTAGNVRNSCRGLGALAACPSVRR